MSEASDSAHRRPPRRRCRIQQASSSSTSSAPAAPSPAPSPVAGSSRTSASPRGGGCSTDQDRQEGSRVSTSDDMEFVVPHIDNELLIQLVEACPALWDHTNLLHADHHYTKRLWMHICDSLFTSWEDLTAAQKDFVEKVITRGDQSGTASREIITGRFRPRVDPEQPQSRNICILRLWSTYTGRRLLEVLPAAHGCQNQLLKRTWNRPPPPAHLSLMHRFRTILGLTLETKCDGYVE
ncbi:uncharacterized protein LOC122942491 isoform X2 [Bufo gargarizans]|nr:uncharacterized protein LOC122942491 isoform X2 [Bufo gargarizans]